MDDSVLTTVKKLLGIMEDYEHFDTDILFHINTVLMILNQLGVGPPNGMFVTDKSTTWRDITDGKTDLGCLQSYVFLRVKLIFDPPLTSSVIESMNRVISELEWRLNITVDTGEVVK